MKAYLSKNVFIDGGFRPAVLLVSGEQIADVVSHLPPGFSGEIEDFGDHYLIPGLVDTHVHINEPGRTEWEGFTTATQAAAAGGITTVIDMPLNCIPVTTSKSAFFTKLATVKDQLWVDVGFWGGVTADNFEDLPPLLDSGVWGVKSFLIDSGIPEFSHVTFEQVAKAMPLLAQRDMPYLFHAEWQEGAIPLVDTYKNYGGFVASRPAAWEDRAIEQVIKLCGEWGCKAHIVHLSSATALPLIKKAKQQGIPLTAETCPHYLLFDAETLDREVPGSRLPLYKCCPPIRDHNNQTQLWQGLKEGAIDFVVSDHSPCTANLKRLEEADLEHAWGGVSGLQFGFGTMAQACADKGITLPRLIELMTIAPANWIGLGSRKGSLAKGKDADFFVWDPFKSGSGKVEDTLYRNKLHAYNESTIKGSVLQTYVRGNLAINHGVPVSKAPGTTLMRNP